MRNISCIYGSLVYWKGNKNINDKSNAMTVLLLHIPESTVFWIMLSLHLEEITHKNVGFYKTVYLHTFTSIGA